MRFLAKIGQKTVRLEKLQQINAIFAPKTHKHVEGLVLPDQAGAGGCLDLDRFGRVGSSAHLVENVVDAQVDSSQGGACRQRQLTRD